MKSIADIIFTRRCPFCEEIIELKENECSSCKRNFPNPRMKKAAGTICAYPLPYKGIYREAILRYKFERQHYLAPQLAFYMAETVRNCFDGERFDLISYVPVYKDRPFKFNHSKLLAEKLSKALSLPCEETLIKKFKTQKQHDISYEMRKSNVKNAFAPRDDYSGRVILLVDDIITTGNTMSECIKALRQGRAENVFAIALCGPHYE